MNSSVSSAVPEKLIHYADVTRELDATLQSTARRLRAQLEHFEAQCVEPDFRLHVSGQADDLRSYANQCEPVDARVREVGQQFQIADSRWGGSSLWLLGNWTSTTWTSLHEEVALTLSKITGLLSLVASPDWLQGKIPSLPWTMQNYSDWMPDTTKSIEFSGRYIAKRLNIKEADFNLADVLLFLFSKTPFCNDQLRETLESADDLKTAYGLITKFSEVNFMFFMAGILSNPERYIDPWLDKINAMTLFPNKPAGIGSGPTNLHGRDMSEMPGWMKAFSGGNTDDTQNVTRGGVLGVTTAYAAEFAPSSATTQMPNIPDMSLIQRRKWLAQVQTEISTYQNKLFELQASGAREDTTYSNLEQQLADLRQKRANLQSQTNDWRNEIRVSEQGIKPGFDDGFLDAPWRTRSDDLETEIENLSEEIAILESQLPHQKEFDQIHSQLQAAEHTEDELQTSLEEHWWNDVPPQSQKDLTYKNKATEYGCTPTATAMVLEYWHDQDPTNGMLSAQELLDINATQGEFKFDGMSASGVHDEVQSLGYSFVQDYINSDFETLQEAVEQGPVIAIVKLNMATRGKNHAVVVTGISPDGSQVQINDPWTGKTYFYTREQFTQSWGAKFGSSGTQKNSFLVIRPS